MFNRAVTRREARRILAEKEGAVPRQTNPVARAGA